jgi:hypothetical protein
MPETRAPAARRLLNVSLLAGSGAHRAYHDRSGSSVSELTAGELAAGFPPRPALNLRFFGGRTIAHLVFVNHYLGGAAAWMTADIASIDAALAKAMSDNDLQSVIQQYYDTPISSRMLPSMMLPGSAPATIYKDQVEAVVARICRYSYSALDGAGTGSTVINILLPRGVVLVDGFTAGFQPPPGQEAEHERRRRAVVRVGGEDADSRHGLGGYHGSARVTPCGTAYYAVAVYPESGNGVPVFDQPWKNVAATVYHQLNEARTDPDVDDAIRTGDSTRLGWYSARGGEIGDIPVKEAGTSLALVFREVDLADGSGSVPVQLMWSNKTSTPAIRLA